MIMAGPSSPAIGSNKAGAVPPTKRRKPNKRNGIAAALKFFKPKIVKPKKGTKAYSRKKLQKPAIDIDEIT